MAVRIRDSTGTACEPVGDRLLERTINSIKPYAALFFSRFGILSSDKLLRLFRFLLRLLLGFSVIPDQVVG